MAGTMQDSIDQLADFFANHPVWVEAARPVKNGANSEVFFAGLSDVYHLMREGGHSYLRKGPAPSPDFSFVFTPAAVQALVEIEGKEIADFALTLFDHIKTEDASQRIGFRVCGSIPRILRRGYLQVMLKGGPRVLQYAGAHGIRSLSDFSRLLRGLRGKDIDWTQFKG